MQSLMPTWAFWALGSAFFAGLTAILAKVGVTDLDSNLATAIRTAVILVVSWAIVAGTGVFKQIHALNGRSVLFLVLSGLATGASWLCYFHALKLGPASKVAPIDKLSVVFVLLLSALFLHESVGLKTVVGVVCMVAGALLVAQK